MKPVDFILIGASWIAIDEGGQCEPPRHWESYRIIRIHNKFTLHVYFPTIFVKEKIQDNFRIIHLWHPAREKGTFLMSRYNYENVVLAISLCPENFWQKKTVISNSIKIKNLPQAIIIPCEKTDEDSYHAATRNAFPSIGLIHPPMFRWRVREFPFWLKPMPLRISGIL